MKIKFSEKKLDIKFKIWHIIHFWYSSLTVRSLVYHISWFLIYKFVVAAFGQYFESKLAFSLEKWNFHSQESRHDGITLVAGIYLYRTLSSIEQFLLKYWFSLNLRWIVEYGICNADTIPISKLSFLKKKKEKSNELFAMIKQIHCRSDFSLNERKKAEEKYGYFSPLNRAPFPFILFPDFKHNTFTQWITFNFYFIPIEKFPTFHWNVKYVNFSRHQFTRFV